MDSGGRTTYASATVEGTIVLRWAHVVLVVVFQLVAMGAMWGAMKYQVDSDERRIQRLEDSHFSTDGVSQKQFDEFKDDLKSRLVRIETKVDLLDAKH